MDSQIPRVAIRRTLKVRPLMTYDLFQVTTSDREESYRDGSLLVFSEEIGRGSSKEERGSPYGETPGPFESTGISGTTTTCTFGRPCI